MLGAFDFAAFRFINGTLANPVFDAIMPILTALGSGEFVFIVSMFVLILALRDKKIAGIYLLAGLTLTYFTVDILKGAIAIPRPFITLADMRLIVPKSDGFAFPSGHAVTAFMAAAIVSRYFKRGAIWFSLATLAAFSRVYIGVHYLSDVIAGAAIGVIIGYGLLIISGAQKFNLPPTR